MKEGGIGDFFWGERHEGGAEDASKHAIGRAYNVRIIAEDATGNEIEFIEVVKYPDNSQSLSGSVDEMEREGDAIKQVKARMPHHRNIRSKGSMSTLFKR